MVTPATIAEEKIWSVLETVTDPEVPVLTIIDLGIVRDVILKVSPDGATDPQVGGESWERSSVEEVEIIITPTYTGCPAMDMIAMNIKLALAEQGYQNIKINSVLSPVWTTDWMSEEGKRKLKEYGIAAPDKKFTIPADGVECPQCHSHHTRLVSEFGSTACKALYQCKDCKEPFDYFKCH
jgi:ring-1,2-phenylacetyl-CoA epoxidase subunit PaaD